MPQTPDLPYPPAAVQVASDVARLLAPVSRGGHDATESLRLHSQVADIVLTTLKKNYAEIHGAAHRIMSAAPDALPGSEGHVDKEEMIQSMRLAWGCGRDVVATAPGAWHTENLQKGENL